jgi:hypothetical protein
MVQQSRSVFLIENLQPTWLSSPLMQRIYRVIVMGLVGLVFGIVMGLLAKVLNYEITVGAGLQAGFSAGIISGIVIGFLPKLKSNWSFGIMAGVASGLIFGLITDPFQPLNTGIFGLVSGIILQRLNHETIEPADTVQWSWNKGKHTFIVSMIWGLVAGGSLLIARRFILPRDVVGAFLCNPDAASKGFGATAFWRQLAGSVVINFFCQEDKEINALRLLGLLLLGVFVGFAVCVVLGFKKIAKVESRTIPNHGIWKSARNSCNLVAICGSLLTVVSILVWLIYFFTSTPDTPAANSQFIWWIYYGNALPDGLMFGLSVGVFVGLASGLVGGENSGLVIIQHFVLRVMLWITGKIPWNYARFLNYAAERILLKKVGGGYIFIHRLLLEHFAQLR